MTADTQEMEIRCQVVHCLHGKRSSETTTVTVYRVGRSQWKYSVFRCLILM